MSESPAGQGPMSVTVNGDPSHTTCSGGPVGSWGTSWLEETRVLCPDLLAEASLLWILPGLVAGHLQRESLGACSWEVAPRGPLSPEGYSRLPKPLLEPLAGGSGRGPPLRRRGLSLRPLPPWRGQCRMRRLPGSRPGRGSLRWTVLERHPHGKGRSEGPQRGQGESGPGRAALMSSAGSHSLSLLLGMEEGETNTGKGRKEII